LVNKKERARRKEAPQAQHITAQACHTVKYSSEDSALLYSTASGCATRCHQLKKRSANIKHYN